MALNARPRHPCLPSDSGLVLGLCSPGESPGQGEGGGGGARSRSCACESWNCASVGLGVTCSLHLYFVQQMVRAVTL